MVLPVDAALSYDLSGRVPKGNRLALERVFFELDILGTGWP